MPRYAKPSQRQMRGLIKDYGIEFRGLLSPSQWPEQYRKVFSQVREVGCIEADEYVRNENADSSVDEMIARVGRLVNEACKARVRRVNEETLRGSEHLVFSRFNNHIKCQRCLNNLWLSTFSALPDDAEKARRAQRRQAHRTLCKCPQERDWRTEGGGTLLFTNDSSKSVEYDPVDRLNTHNIGTRRPDRIIGLARMGSLDHYCRNGVAKELRHSPCPDSDIVYPFMIVEAKPEYSGLGFEAIETQTAFPLRAFVKLQDDLQKRTKVSFNPLVWFVAYQGDEWRIGAGIVEGDKFVSNIMTEISDGNLTHPIIKPVIDLWMGRSTSRDGALQLLQLMDYICDWARNVYREQIKHCLAGGEDNLRGHLSPVDASRHSSSERESTFFTDAPSQPVQESSEVEMIYQAGPSHTVNEILHGAEIYPEQIHAADQELLLLKEEISSHIYLKWMQESPQSAPWTTSATIRHSDMTAFGFTHFRIPQEETKLEKFLGQMSSVTANPPHIVARALLAILRDEERAISTTIGQIQELKTEWLKKSYKSALHVETQVRAIFRFRTNFRRFDWHIIREFECVSCTRDVAILLARFAEIDGLRGSHPRSWWPEQDIDPSLSASTSLRRNEGGITLSPSIFTSFRRLAGQDAAISALRSTTLYLTVQEIGEEDRYVWTSNDNNTVASSVFFLCESIRTFPAFQSLLDRSVTIMEVFRGSVEEYIKRLIGPPLSGDPSGILLYKGDHWPNGTPRWCFMVWDKKVDFRSKEAIGWNLLQIAASSDHCFTFDCNALHPGADTPKQKLLNDTLDMNFLNLWVDSLTSQEPPR